MRYPRLVIPVLALAMMGTAGMAFGQGYGQRQGYGYPQQGYGQSQQGYGQQQRDGYGRDDRREGDDRDDRFGGETRDIARQGFRDGLDGAQRDLQNHRRPDVNNRDEYRRPNVPGYARRDYKIAFRRGYDEGIEHAFGRGSDRQRQY